MTAETRSVAGVKISLSLRAAMMALDLSEPIPCYLPVIGWRYRQVWVEAIDTINFSKWCITVYEKMMISILKIMAKAKIEHIHNFPLMTSQHALYYLQSFRFPDDLLRKIIHPL